MDRMNTHKVQKQTIQRSSKRLSCFNITLHVWNSGNRRASFNSLQLRNLINLLTIRTSVFFRDLRPTWPCAGSQLSMPHVTCLY